MRAYVRDVSERVLISRQRGRCDELEEHVYHSYTVRDISLSVALLFAHTLGVAKRVR